MAKEFRLKNGALFLAVESAGGIYNASQLECLAKVCEEKALVAKLTEDQRISIVVQESELAHVAKTLNEAGMGLRHYQDGIHQASSCIGGLCTFSCQDALATSVKLSETLAKIETLTPLKIGINGCPRSCVPTHTLDISLIGDEGGYQFYLGGRNRQLPELGTFMAEDVPKDRVPSYVLKLIEFYKENAADTETLGELMERIGLSPFVKILEPYSQNAFGEILGDPMVSESNENEKLPLAGLDESIVDEDPSVLPQEAKADDSSSRSGKLSDYIEELEEFTDEAEFEEQNSESLPVAAPSRPQVHERVMSTLDEPWEFRHVSVDDKNGILLSFSSGATVLLKIDKSTANGKRTFGFGTSTIQVSWSVQKIVIECGEITIGLPRKAPTR